MGTGAARRPLRCQERTGGHLDQAAGSGKAEEGVSPRGIVEGEFTAQDDWMCGLWRGEEGRGSADAKVSSQSD